jgi:hypothetical protein
MLGPARLTEDVPDPCFTWILPFALHARLRRPCELVDLCSSMRGPGRSTAWPLADNQVPIREALPGPSRRLTEQRREEIVIGSRYRTRGWLRRKPRFIDIHPMA